MYVFLVRSRQDNILEMNEINKIMMKEKFSKITYMLVMLFMASSFEVLAVNPDGPDEPVVIKKSTENPPANADYTIGQISPMPVKAANDHNEANSALLQPVISLEPATYMPTYTPAVAAPVEVMSKAMPASFKGVAANEILGWDNLSSIFNEIARGEKTVRILQIGDSHVRGNIYPQTIQKYLESQLNTSRKAVSFDFIGINGARASKFTSEEMLRQIASKRPDLVIISFGTNEAHGNFNSSSNTKVMESLVSGIRQKNPNVNFLITTTPGSYISKSGRGKVVNTTHEDVARNLLEFGYKNHIAVWDLYHNIGGNENACRNLITANMMQGDRIHLTVSGYRMVGNMFGEAFVNAYNNFLKR